MATYRSRSRSAATRTHRRRPGSPLPVHTEERPLFTAIEDLNRGNLPHNDQLKQWLSYLGRSFDVPSSKLSPSGQALMRDLSKLVSLLRSVVDEKNSDELLQRFFYHSKLAARLAVQGLTRSGKIQIVKEPRRQVYLFGARDEEVRERAKKMRKEALREVRALYRLVQFMLGSTEFRQVVSQAQSLIGKVFAPETSRRATQPRVQFKSTRTEEPHKPGKTVVEPSDLDEKIRNLRTEVKSTEASFQKQTRADVFGPNVSGEFGYQQLSGFVEVTEQTTEQGEYLYQSKGIGKGAEEFEQPIKQGKREIRRIGEEREEEQAFPEPTGQQTRENPIFKETRIGMEPSPAEAVEEEEEFYQVEEPEQVVPQQYERVGDEEILEDIKNIFRRVGANPEFQKTIRDALTYLRSLQSHTTAAIREPTGPIPGELQYEENIKAAQKDLLLLLERFAGGKSVQPIVQIIGRIQGRVQEDYELKDFFEDWTAFVKRCLKDQSYLESEEFDRRAKFLLDRTRTFSQSKYRQDFDQVNQSLNEFLAGWQQDHLTRSIGDTLQRIIKEDIQSGTSTNGLFLFNAMNPDLISDFRHTILPSLLANLHELPIPRIESVSDGTRLVLENIVIPAGGFVPVDLDVRTQARLRMSPRERLRGEKKGTSGWQNGLRIRMAGMQANVQNVRFAIDKTKGWPILHDDGLADLSFGRRGMSIIINLAAASQSQLSKGTGLWPRTKQTSKEALGGFYLDPRYVRVKIDRLKLHMHDTRRDWMYKLASPFLASRIKRQIEASVRDQIVSAIQSIDNISRGVSKGIFSDISSTTSGTTLGGMVGTSPLVI